ncbi:TrmB family transcriptional regulator, partial [Candidatus Bathyarchaeota archaeon]
RSVGLTEYETLAYLSLLVAGEMTAENVSESSSIPYTKVYSVLDSLHSRGWVESESGRPRKYYPRPPVDALRQEKNRLDDEFDANMQIILDELQPLFEMKDIKEIPEIFIIRGEGSSFSKIIDLLGRANKEIMLAIPFIPDNVLQGDTNFRDLLKTTIKRYMDSDIVIKVLTTRETLKSVDFPEIHIAEIRVTDSMFGGGLVIDGKETIIFLDLKYPVGPDTAIWSEHETLTSIAGIYFKHMWDNAEPTT